MKLNESRLIKYFSVFIGFLLIPVIMPEFYIHLVTEIMIYILFTIGLNLLLGYGGLLAFGYGAFFGIGAYTSALISNYLLNVSLLSAILISTAVAFIMALIIGALCVRLKGAYFALLTFAFQMFLFAVAVKAYSITGGDDGMSAVRPPLYIPLLGDVSLNNIYQFYYFVFIIVSIGILSAFLFTKTPLGNSVIAMRENETRAIFLGYNVYWTRVVLVGFSGALAGLSGSLFAYFNKFISTTCIDVNLSMMVVIMCIIGGKKHFWGPALGAVIYMLVQNWLSDITIHWWLFLGIFYVVIVLCLPGGLMSLNTSRFKSMIGFKV